jgi:iron complex outermembrane receptor protein
LGKSLFVGGFCIIAVDVRAQDSTTVPPSTPPPSADSVARARTTLNPVVITVTRGLSPSPLDAPFAMTVLRPDSTRPGQRHTALDESLALVPGLTAVNRTNPSQDPRISIRGFGSRSAFGVRGVKVLRDGIPLTLPDGQTPVDYLSLESVDRIEIIRGAAAALYGNASGGVIDLRTEAPPAARFRGEIRQWVGDFASSRSTFKGGGISGPMYYQADLSLNRNGGFRIYSRQRSTSGFARVGAMLGGTDYAVEVLGLDLPLAENPGAITLAQFESNPRLADQPSVNKLARKEVQQIQVGVSANRQRAHDELSVNAYVGGRSLYNPLTFAVVDFGRRTAGASARLTHLWSAAVRPNRLTVGFDLQSQNDSRRNFANCNDNPPPSVVTTSCPVLGAERGSLTLDQRELVSGLGAYLNNELRITEVFRVSGGVRADNIRFEVRDRLLGGANPDDSGRRTLRAVTPYVGIVSKIAPDRSIYANVSSAFETPTATELGNHPDGSAGINQDLAPQKSTTYEIGSKGFFGQALSYDVAVFSTRVRDELVPYEIPLSGGRRYFRNAGRTNRRGGEAGFAIAAQPVTFNGSYSYSDFRFSRYVTDSAVFDGRRIPGIPIHRGQASVSLARARAFGLIEAEAASTSYVDDANTQRAPAYQVVHIRGGLTRLFGFPFASVVVGVQNLFDRVYSASVSVNAARGKFFEPAAGRIVYAGFSIGFAIRDQIDAMTLR